MTSKVKLCTSMLFTAIGSTEPSYRITEWRVYYYQNTCCVCHVHLDLMLRVVFHWLSQLENMQTMFHKTTFSKPSSSWQCFAFWSMQVAVNFLVVLPYNSSIYPPSRYSRWQRLCFTVYHITIHNSRLQ